MAAGGSAAQEARARERRLERLKSQVEREERQLEAWTKGYVGEVKVGQHLDPLRSHGYVHIDDRRLPASKANIDHLLVGPTGVWIVDAKNWSGTLTVDGTSLRQNGRARDDRVDALRWQAVTVSSVIQTKVPQGVVSVRPAMCFSGEARLGRHVVVDRVHLVDVEELHLLVLSKQPRLTTEQVLAVTRFLHEQLPERTSAPRPSSTPIAPTELVLYIQPWRKSGRHRLYVKRGDGTQLGFLDVVTGAVRATTPADAPLLARLLPHFVDGAEGGEALTGEAAGTLRRFLQGFLRRPGDVDHREPLVVANVWRKHGLRRLYVNRIDGLDTKTPLGWFDLDSGAQRADAPGADGTIAYCGQQFLANLERPTA